jgi:hypothetical protein
VYSYYSLFYRITEDNVPYLIDSTAQQKISVNLCSSVGSVGSVLKTASPFIVKTASGCVFQNRGREHGGSQRVVTTKVR